MYTMPKNKIIRHHSTWLEIDVSTPKHPNAVMKIDNQGWNKIKMMSCRSRVSVKQNKGCKSMYAVVAPRGRKKYVHRILMGSPKGMEIDHINQDGLDNRRQNLRVVERWQNAVNMGIRSNNTSGVKGVYYHTAKKRWIARIHHEGIYKYLGIYDTLVEATKVRQEAEQKYHKGFIASERSLV